MSFITNLQEIPMDGRNDMEGLFHLEVQPVGIFKDDLIDTLWYQSLGLNKSVNYVHAEFANEVDRRTWTLAIHYDKQFKGVKLRGWFQKRTDDSTVFLVAGCERILKDESVQDY